jgi:hypothetical protein
MNFNIRIYQLDEPLHFTIVLLLLLVVLLVVGAEPAGRALSFLLIFHYPHLHELATMAKAIEESV